MKQLLTFSLVFLFLTGCIATKNIKNSWTEKLLGPVKAVHETTYKATSDIDKDNPFKQVSLRSIAPRDSSVTIFNRDVLPIESLFYCKQFDENQKETFGLCFRSSSNFDNKGRLKKIQNLSYIDNDTSIFKYKAYNELQLPVFIEETDLSGKVVKNHVLDFNRKGRLVSTRIVYKKEKKTVAETHFLFEYNRKGLVSKMEVETRNAKGQIEEEPTTYTYKYFEFDRKGNWTKRMEISSLNEDKPYLTYRWYEYYN